MNPPAFLFQLMKRKKMKRPVRKRITYTHRTSDGMLWRFVGSLPVSKLADQVMRDAGMKLP